jgi:hypothetical protein
MLTVHFGQQAELRMRYIPYLHNSTSMLPYYRMVQEEKNIADRHITWMWQTCMQILHYITQSSLGGLNVTPLMQ